MTSKDKSTNKAAGNFNIGPGNQYVNCTIEGLGAERVNKIIEDLYKKITEKLGEERDGLKDFLMHKILSQVVTPEILKEKTESLEECFNNALDSLGDKFSDDLLSELESQTNSLEDYIAKQNVVLTNHILSSIATINNLLSLVEGVKDITAETYSKFLQQSKLMEDMSCVLSNATQTIDDFRESSNKNDAEIQDKVDAANKGINKIIEMLQGRNIESDQDRNRATYLAQSMCDSLLEGLDKVNAETIETRVNSITSKIDEVKDTVCENNAMLKQLLEKWVVIQIERMDCGCCNSSGSMTMRCDVCDNKSVDTNVPINELYEAESDSCMRAEDGLCVLWPTDGDKLYIQDVREIADETERYTVTKILIDSSVDSIFPGQKNDTEGRMSISGGIMQIFPNLKCFSLMKKDISKGKGYALAKGLFEQKNGSNINDLSFYGMKYVTAIEDGCFRGVGMDDARSFWDKAGFSIAFKRNYFN